MNYLFYFPNPFSVLRPSTPHIYLTLLPLGAKDWQLEQSVLSLVLLSSPRNIGMNEDMICCHTDDPLPSFSDDPSLSLMEGWSSESPLSLKQNSAIATNTAKTRPQNRTTKTPPIFTAFREEALDLSPSDFGHLFVPCFHHLL